ncbi:beta-phosphoglucomutase family hydrolase [Pontibacter qinzhouensis]|uniref:Beta-phosphoglucomutase n=1 Tax=Pontibacter qinzhouensis TaxID=2603253 RepID=A0A5C8K5X2_9BACT|nr:beta-phosphoglucomutase family hydrolase [Pontibacter qinzhouensis]
MKALILDMDGVITNTAVVHAEAWKKMTDLFLKKRGEKDGKSYKPFDVVEDYRSYVDGMPRYDGVRNFLESRGITIPEGEAADDDGKETIIGLGNLKNLYFQELLKQNGVVVFEDTLAWVKAYKKNGLKTAVISSSKNCFDIIRRGGLEQLFEARVDGLVSGELKLKGKPEPDIFLEAAKRLGVKPEETAIFEDAWAGVAAGKAGNFALVVGINRGNAGQTLEENGADIVISKFPKPE